MKPQWKEQDLGGFDKHDFTNQSTKTNLRKYFNYMVRKLFFKIIIVNEEMSLVL